MKHTAFPLSLALLLASCAGAPATPPPAPPGTPAPLEEPTPPTEEPEDLTFGEEIEEKQGEVLPPPPLPPDLSTEALPARPSRSDGAKVEAPPEGAEGGAAQKRAISVTVQNWSFGPSLITAKKNETVELQLTGISGTHGFAVPALGINVSVAPGETKTVLLPTDTPGTYELFCSIPCGAGHKDMRGTVVIEP